MTTKVKTKIEKDLNKNNSIYNLNEEFELAGIEFYIDEKTISKNEDIDLILNEYVYTEIKEALTDSKIWLVVTTWVTDNKLSRYKIAQGKKFWGTFTISKLESKKFDFISDDVIVDKINNHLILLTVLEVSKISFDYAIKTLRKNSGVLMFISSNESFNSIDNIETIYKFFYNTYASLKGLKHLEEDILVRAGIIEQYRVPYIDFFLSSRKLSTLKL